MNDPNPAAKELAAIEETRFPPDPREFFKAMADDRPPHIGPETFPISYSGLPQDSRVATIRYWFLVGHSAQIWPEGQELKKVELAGPRGTVQIPVGPSRRWLIHLPPKVELGTELVDAR